MRKIFYNPEGSAYEQAMRKKHDPNFAKWLVVSEDNPHVLTAHSDLADVVVEIHLH